MLLRILTKWTRSQGIDEAKRVFATSESMGIKTVDVEILYEIPNENMVLNERVVHLLDKDGKQLIALRVMAIFEVNNGKIVSWRD